MSILQNPHTTVSAIVFIAAKYGALIAEQWWPDYFNKIDNTANILEGAAAAWGLYTAGRQNPQSKQAIADVNDRLNKTQDVLQTSGADTSRLARTETPIPDSFKQAMKEVDQGKIVDFKEPPKV